MVSEAGFLYTSGLFITKRIFLDFLMVTLDTPATCFKPSLDMIFLAFFLAPALLGLAGIITSSTSSSSYSSICPSLTGGFFQFRDGVIVTVRIVAIADLFKLGVKDFGELRHDERLWS